MSETEFDDLMRKALRDGRLWDEVAATMPDDAEEWLTRTSQKVQGDLGRKKAQWATQAANLHGRSREYREAQSDYLKWRKAAIGFKSVVDDRNRELKAQGRKSNLHRAADRETAASATLLRLAKAVEAHQADRIYDSDLYRLLDELTMPHGIDGEMPIREVLNRIALSPQGAA